MIECAMPHDILKYKAKFIMNFTVREFVCLTTGGISCLLSYFTFLKNIPGRMYLAALIAVPFFLIGFTHPFGQPFEKIVGQIIFDNFICPVKRQYEIRHPEYEAFLQFGKITTEPTEESDKKKKSPKKQQTKEKKIKKSKEYKAIQ